MSRLSKAVASAMAWCVAATRSSGAAATSNRAESCRRTPRSACASSSKVSTNSAFLRRESARRSWAIDSGRLLAGAAFFGLRWDMASAPLAVSLRLRPRLVRQSLAVIPGHPQLGTGRDPVGVPLQLRQVVERVGLIHLAGVDQAHEQVADARPVLGLVEQGILAV